MMYASKLTLVALSVLMLLSSCTALPATPAAPSASTPSEFIGVDSTPGDAALDDYRLESLSFAGNGNTFLAAIEDAADESLAHRFVELTDEVGNEWQGELLGFADEASLFLQLMQRGGAEAVRIDGPSEFDLDAVLTLLPQAAAKPLASPHPELRFVRARQNGDTWTFDVTLAYPDTGWEDYADGWHVATPAGAILGTRVLLHPHVNEQPFTRSLSNVAIPVSVSEVVIRSHDLVSGYGPDVVTLPLDAPAVTERYEVIRTQ